MASFEIKKNGYCWNDYLVEAGLGSGCRSIKCIMIGMWSKE